MKHSLPMAKNVKKAKAASKPTSKPSAKPVKKQAKPVREERPSQKKAKVSESTEISKKKVGPVSQKTEKTSAAKVKPTKADSKGKKAKAKKESEEFDDDLMVSDEELGGEEIPDLSEFDETEEDVVEIEVVEEVVVTNSTPAASDEAVLTDAEGRPYCKVRDCDQVAVVDGYCRFHYLLLWKRIQVRRKILTDGKLERYVEDLTARYPDKFLEMIKRDLRTEKDFLAAIAELEIDESGLESDFEDESQVLDEVRGFGNESAISDDEEF